MYIGTSLGGCLRSILAGEVSEEEVVFIVTRTNAPNIETYELVIKQYYAYGNPHSRNSNRYELSDYPLDDVMNLAKKLWSSGKIHQPRTYTGQDGRYTHPVSYGDGIWLFVAPVNRNQSPAVIEAWEQYKMLDTLTT